MSLGELGEMLLIVFTSLPAASQETAEILPTEIVYYVYQTV